MFNSLYLLQVANISDTYDIFTVYSYSYNYHADVSAESVYVLLKQLDGLERGVKILNPNFDFELFPFTTKRRGKEGWLRLRFLLFLHFNRRDE